VSLGVRKTRARDLEPEGEAHSPFLSAFLVCSCSDESHVKGEDCDGAAVFALDASSATELGASRCEEPRAARARPRSDLERLLRWGPVVTATDPRRRVRLAWRAAGWRYEGEAACESCNLFAFDLADKAPCDDCAACPDCGCAEWCPIRAQRTTFTLEPGWNVWVGPGSEPGTGRIFSATRFANDFAGPREHRYAQWLGWIFGGGSHLRARAEKDLRGKVLGTSDEAHGLILARLADGCDLGAIRQELSESLALAEVLPLFSPAPRRLPRGQALATLLESCRALRDARAAGAQPSSLLELIAPVCDALDLHQGATP